jgi:two-component system, NarL family, sensor histidine kinase DesK
MHVRLFPTQRGLGWMPIAWLIYVIPFAITPVLQGAGALECVATWTALAVFFVLYFRGFWLRERRVVPAIVGIVAIGVIFAPFNTGSSCFFVYGGAFAGSTLKPREAVLCILGILLVLAVETLTVGVHPSVWLPAAVFSFIVGGTNIHFAEARRTDTKLRLAHEEVARLATVAERDRIARDLHDLLGHTLSLVAVKSDLAARLAERDPSRAAMEIRDVGRIARVALAEVRKAVYGFRAGTLAEEAENAKAALAASGIAVECDVEPVGLSSAREGALALALREAVTNVVRHSSASTCRIRVVGDGASVRLEVSDNGVGGDALEGAGLSGMRGRLRDLGGTVERDGTRGTRLTVTLPVIAEPEEAVG